MSNSVPNARKRLVRTILLDLLAVGICLNVFAYFHHVRKAEPTPKALTSPTPMVSTDSAVSASEPTAAPETSATEAPAAVDTGLLGGKFAERFTTGDVEQTENSYRSANVAIEISKVTAGATHSAINTATATTNMKNGTRSDFGPCPLPLKLL